MKNLGFLGHEHYAVNQKGEVMTLRKSRLLKPTKSKLGYMVVTLGGSERKTWKIHRLVMLAHSYQDGCEDMQVNHIDGDKENNHLSNLEWCTSQHNNLHAIRTGLRPLKNLTEDDVHKACRLFEDGWRNCDIAKALGLSSATIGHVRKGDLCSYISDHYSFDKRKYNQRSLGTVQRICELLQGQTLNSVEISKEMGVTPDYVRNIKARTIQTVVSQNYTW